MRNPAGSRTAALRLLSAVVVRMRLIDGKEREKERERERGASEEYIYT